MKAEDQKRIANHYGVLCGLRSAAESDSSRSTTPEPLSENMNEAISTSTTEGEAVQLRPQSLTLPFENRDRESHLVSDEEFDRIVKQAEYDNPLPPMLSSTNRRPPPASLRRSISTARNRMSMMSAGPRPMSADFSTLTSLIVDRQGAPQRASSVLLRDPTLTALPRPPTRNDLAVYPSDSTLATLAHAHKLRRPAEAANKETSAGHDRIGSKDSAFKMGHKRHFSAADMVEQVKKRLKRNGNELRDGSSPNKLSISSPMGLPSSPQYQSHPTVCPGEDIVLDDAKENVTPSTSFTASSEAPSSNLKKSLMQRTWSRTKHHAAKLSISSPNSSRPKISGPITTPTSTTPVTFSACKTASRPSTTLSQHTTTSVQTGTSQYYASAEPSPRDPQDKFEYMSGPRPKKSILTRLGAPPSRNELNTVVTRQQSRIVDLTLQNNVLCNQIEILRGELQGLKVHHGNTACIDTRHTQTIAQESDNDASSERTVHRRSRQVLVHPDDVLASRRPLSGTPTDYYDEVSVHREISGGHSLRNANGWQAIMGVPVADDEKRKTWMTCDS